MFNKGARLYVIAGKYSGLHGWYNADRQSTRKSHYIIVATLEGEEKSVCVRRTSVGPPRDAPATYVEAILDQHPVIDEDISKLCRKLAECRLEISDIDEIAEIISIRLADAMQTQISFGRSAMIRPVDFDRSNAEDL